MPSAICDFDFDVLVAGGGPAGLAAAIAARRQGLSVLVADSITPPIDKACGEGLMPDAQAALSDLGLEIPLDDVGRFQGIKFIGREGSVAARFPYGEGIGIRRTVLHQWLVESAGRLGVQTRWGQPVRALEPTRAKVGNDVIRFRWLVGADGQHSSLRKWARLTGAREYAQRFGMRQHFRVKPRSEFVEIYWADRGQAYVTPIGAREICVALISRERFPSFAAGLALFPPLARHLENADRSTQVRGAITVSRSLKSVCNQRMALIGEASGSVDAITGEGIALAFRQAQALAKAFVAGDLSHYQRAHRKITALPLFMAQSMTLMDRNSWVRKHALRAFAKEPALFARLLRIHVGDESLRDFGARGILNLGWELLLA